VHIPFSKDRLLAKSKACVDTEDRQERVPDVLTPLNSHSSWVCRYQVAQMLDKHKVQRVASEQMALSSRCLSRHACMFCHQVQNTDALLILDMLVLSHTRSAAQQQVCSCNSFIHGFYSRWGQLAHLTKLRFFIRIVRQQLQQKRVKSFFFFFFFF